MTTHYFPAQIETRRTVQMTDFGLREPLGWRVAGLSQTSEIALSWHGELVFDERARLRIAVLDTREARICVEIRLRQSARVVGAFEIRWAAHFQVFEVELSAADAADVAREGAVLRVVEGQKPLWVLIGANDETPLPDALSPHLLRIEAKSDPVEKRAEFFARLGSLASVQCFGWMEGCVLDGLSDLVALPAFSHLKPALHVHLKAFFSPDGGPFYEAFARWPDGTPAFGAPADGHIYGIEATLPFAALCREFPSHPALQIALDFWNSHVDGEGAIQDGQHLSTEGAYTVGYPLALLAKARGNHEMAQCALLQITLRHERLFDGKRLARTRQPKAAGDFDFGNLNWARGVAWQLLGAARTLSELDGSIDIQNARAQFAELAAWTLEFQLPGGLWSVFLDEPDLAPDTSASAGLAAAFAIGARRGWLSNEFTQAAQLTDAALEAFLTPDGFLFGASASNKGGEALQRAPYRPIYQMGMGLMAQLIAALHEEIT